MMQISFFFFLLATIFIDILINYKVAFFKNIPEEFAPGKFIGKTFEIQSNLYFKYFITVPVFLIIPAFASEYSDSRTQLSIHYWLWYNEKRHEKTCIRRFRPGKTQTGLLSYRDQLESWKFGFRKYRYDTI